MTAPGQPCRSRRQATSPDLTCGASRWVPALILVGPLAAVSALLQLGVRLEPGRAATSHSAAAVAAVGVVVLAHR
jgi:hypothetical protein